MQEAAHLTLQYFRKNLRIEEKPGDQGIVTEADKATENFLKERILARDSSALFLAEESAAELGQSIEPGRTLWIIDPIDGTTNFSKGNPYYCLSVCVGTVENSEVFVPQLGLIMHPATGNLYWAQRGGGLWLGDTRIARQQQTSENKPNLARASLCTGFGYQRGAALEAILRSAHDLQSACLGVRINGAAALDMALTAMGQYECFYEYRLSPWDMAAGALLASEAGLVVRNFWGEELNVLRDKGTIVAQASVYPEVFSRLQQHFAGLREQHTHVETSDIKQVTMQNERTNQISHASAFKKHSLSDRREVFSCKIFGAYQSRLTHAITSQEINVYTLAFSDWVNIIPVTADGHIILIKQHRFGTDTVTLETPGGAVDSNEKDLTQTALRELEEETGLTTKRILALPGVAPNPAIQGNRITYFLAFDVHPAFERKHLPDAFEHIELVSMPFEEALQLVRTGQINHALAALGILLAEPYLRQRSR